MATIICRNCKYFKPDTYYYFSKSYAIRRGYCTHELSTYIDKISGEKYYYTAKEMRNSYSCGHKAKYYEENTDIVKKYLREISAEDITKMIILYLAYLILKSIIMN